MKLEVEIDVEPFDVPETVMLSEQHFKFDTSVTEMLLGVDEKRGVTIPLSMLSIKDLHKMCDDFRDSVFENAGKEQKEVVYRGEL